MTAEEVERRCRANGINVTMLGYISEADAALLLGCSKRTAINWRQDGTGPRHTRVNGRVWYSAEAIADYLNGEERCK